MVVVDSDGETELAASGHARPVTHPMMAGGPVDVDARMETWRPFRAASTCARRRKHADQEDVPHGRL